MKLHLINSDLFKFHMRRFRSLFFVFSVLLIAAFPAQLLIDLYSFDSNYTFSLVDTGGYLFLIFFTVVLASVIPYLFFTFLFTKKSINTFHSLPIKRSSLYVTYTALSYVFVAVPFLISYCLGVVISLFSPIYSLNLSCLIAPLTALILVIPIIGMTNFVIMNTGTLFDATIYTGLLIIAPFVIQLAVSSFVSQFVIGYGGTFFTFAEFISPHMSALVSSPIYQTLEQAALPIYWFGIGIGLHVLNIRIYKRRHSERSEQPFTNRIFFVFMTSIFTLALLIGMFSSTSRLNKHKPFTSISLTLFSIVIGYLVFTILNMMKNRSSRNIKDISKSYVIVTVVAVIISYTIYYTDGFGYTKRLPNIDQIKNVSVSGPGIDIIAKTDPEVIELVYEVHQSLASNLSADKFDGPSSDTDVNVLIRYQIKNGRFFTRNFSVPSADYQEMLEVIRQN